MDGSNSKPPVMSSSTPSKPEVLYTVIVTACLLSKDCPMLSTGHVSPWDIWSISWLSPDYHSLLIDIWSNQLQISAFWNDLFSLSWVSHHHLNRRKCWIWFIWWVSRPRDFDTQARTYQLRDQFWFTWRFFSLNPLIHILKLLEILYWLHYRLLPLPLDRIFFQVQEIVACALLFWTTRAIKKGRQTSC